MAEVAVKPDEVTCVPCKRYLTELQPSLAAAEYVEKAFQAKPLTEYSKARYRPPPALVDPISDLPFVSRFTWHTLKDTRHWCGHCPVCVWTAEQSADANASPWKKRHRLSSESYRWPSVTAALEWYRGIRLEGYAVGSLGEALAKIGKLGTLVRAQGGAEAQKAIEQANDVVTIEGALRRCYTAPSKRGLTRSERFYCLFATSVDGTKAHTVASQLRKHNPGIESLSGPMVAAVARLGRFAVYEHLRERDMVPPR